MDELPPSGIWERRWVCRKQGVTFEEVKSVFCDQDAPVIPDPKSPTPHNTAFPDWQFLHSGLKTAPWTEFPEKYPSVPYLHRLNRTRLLQDKCRTLLNTTVRQKWFHRIYKNFYGILLSMIRESVSLVRYLSGWLACRSAYGASTDEQRVAVGDGLCWLSAY